MTHYNAPDHTLIAKAMTLGIARWYPSTNDHLKGEMCFSGLRYALDLDSAGVPALTQNVRTMLQRLIQLPDPEINEHGGRAYSIKAAPAPADSPLRKMFVPPPADDDNTISTAELIQRLADAAKKRDEMRAELGNLSHLALIAATLPHDQMRLLVSLIHDRADAYSKP